MRADCRARGGLPLQTSEKFTERLRYGAQYCKHRVWSGEDIGILMEKSLDTNGAKCANMCKSCNLKKLQNQLLVARIGFDTTENGPSKVWATNGPPNPLRSQKQLWVRPSERVRTSVSLAGVERVPTRTALMPPGVASWTGFRPYHENR